MPLFIMASRLTSEGAKTIKTKPYRIKNVNADLDKMGVKVLQQYAVLGPYDFINVVEAADQVTVAKASLELCARGTIQVETFPAIPIDEFVKSIHGIEIGNV